jgi:hypothetical protein
MPWAWSCLAISDTEDIIARVGDGLHSRGGRHQQHLLRLGERCYGLGATGRERADDNVHLVACGELLVGVDGFFRVAFIVSRNKREFFAVYTALRVDFFDGKLNAFLHSTPYTATGPENGKMPPMVMTSSFLALQPARATSAARCRNASRC